MERGVWKLVGSFLGRNREEGSVSHTILQINRVASTVKINNHQCTFLADMAKSLIKDIESSSDLIDILFVGTIGEELLHILQRALQLVNLCRDDSSCWLRSTFMRQNHSRHFVSIVEEFHNCLCFPVQERMTGLRMCSFLDEENLKELLKQQLVSSFSTSSTRFMAEVVLQRLSSSCSDERCIPFLPQELTKLDHQGGLLGSGVYGVVFRGTFMKTQIAVKQLHYGGFSEMMKEALVMAELPCPDIHILQLIGFASDKAVVMELMKMDLRNLIQERRAKFLPPFSICTAVDIMCQVAEGMNFLHQNKIIHRDLKPANVLVDFEGKSCSEARRFMVKITDFGTSKCNFNAGSEQTQRRGTIIYMSPEMLLDQQSAGTGNYSLKTDVFSFGILCFEVLMGEKPFEIQHTRPEAHLQALQDGVRPNLPESLPLELRQVIQTCWEGDPGKRPSFEELCRTLWKLKAALVAGQDDSNFQTVMRSGVKVCEAERVSVLVQLLASEIRQVQEFAIGMLLSLSVQYQFKRQISEAPEAVENIVGLLKSGSLAARENAVATLYSLKEEIKNSGACIAASLPAALSILARHGSSRGKKFSEALLFYLEREGTFLPGIRVFHRGRKIVISPVKESLNR